MDGPHPNAFINHVPSLDGKSNAEATQKDEPKPPLERADRKRGTTKRASKLPQQPPSREHLQGELKGKCCGSSRARLSTPLFASFLYPSDRVIPPFSLPASIHVCIVYTETHPFTPIGRERDKGRNNAGGGNEKKKERTMQREDLDLSSPFHRHSRRPIPIWIYTSPACANTFKGGERQRVAGSDRAVARG